MSTSIANAAIGLVAVALSFSAVQLNAGAVSVGASDGADVAVFDSRTLSPSGAAADLPGWARDGLPPGRYLAYWARANNEGVELFAVQVESSATTTDGLLRFDGYVDAKLQSQWQG
ncbi:MAG: hypothetical protein ACE5FA_08925 [Dehalococcoidia bacterium]